MKRLQSNLNSAYIEAANRLRPRKAAHRVVAYVESFDDVAFWRGVLQEFETDEVHFQVMLPSRTTLGKGKKLAMMNQLGPSLGNYMIACVDADYDWLMGPQTSAGYKFLNSPYVFHTYVYAIENYQCYAPGLREACVMSTLNDRQVLDFEAFLLEYSRIIWPLLVWSVWTYGHGAFKDYTLTRFCETVSFHDIKLSNPMQALEALRHRVNRDVAWFQRRFPKGKKTYPVLRQRLLDMGLTPDECYLYMHGHTLFDNVVMPLLSPVCAMLRKEREREITELAEHDTQRQNELSCYQHSQTPIDLVLRKSTSYKDCPQYQLLKADIKRFTADTGLQK